MSGGDRPVSPVDAAGGLIGGLHHAFCSSCPCPRGSGLCPHGECLSVVLLGTLLLFLPQFADLYRRAGLSLPFLTAAFISHQGTAVVWLSALGCLFAILPLTEFFRRGPQFVVTSVLVLYVALTGTIAFSLCMPLLELAQRVG